MLLSHFNFHIAAISVFRFYLQPQITDARETIPPGMFNPLNFWLIYKTRVLIMTIIYSFEHVHIHTHIEHSE